MNVTAASLAEERELELRGRAKGWGDAGVIPADNAAKLSTAMRTKWRVAHIAARATSFVLAILLVAAFFWLMDLLSLPKGWITAIAAVGAAELLIRKKQFLRTGIEEGLYIAGLYAFIFGLPGEGEPEALLLFLAATLIPAFRLRQPLFFVVAVALAIAYVAWRSDELGLEQSAVGYLVAGLLLLTSIAALQFLRARRESPAAETALAIVVALAPAGSYVALIVAHEPHRTPLVFGALMLLYAALLLFTGFRFASHAPLIGALLLATVVGVDIARRFDFPYEWKLIGSGCALLAAALVIERRLRGKQAGLTSDSIVALRDAELLEMAAAAALAPHGRAAGAEHRDAPGVESSETPTKSSFGGGGSSGEF